MTLDELIALKKQTVEPVTVTHIGSIRKCRKAFQYWQLQDTLDGKRVFTVGSNTKSDEELTALQHTIDKVNLDILHLWKIDDSQEVLVLDVTDDGKIYLGESATRERDYAVLLGKHIRYASQEKK